MDWSRTLNSNIISETEDIYVCVIAVIQLPHTCRVISEYSALTVAHNDTLICNYMCSISYGKNNELYATVMPNNYNTSGRVATRWFQTICVNFFMCERKVSIFSCMKT